MSKEIEALIVEKFAANEETIAGLYEDFAQKFPQHKDFWSNLAKEEHQHARWIRRLNTRINQEKNFGRVLIDKFPLQTIERSLEGIKRIAEEAKDADLTFEEALKISMELEESLLEKRYFEIFQGEQAEINQVLGFLEKETIMHSDRIRKLLKDNS